MQSVTRRMYYGPPSEPDALSVPVEQTQIDAAPEVQSVGSPAGAGSRVLVPAIAALVTAAAAGGLYLLRLDGAATDEKQAIWIQAGVLATAAAVVAFFLAWKLQG